MNKYIVPIYSYKDDYIWNEIIIANTLAQCQDKLIDKMSERYEISEAINYNDFCKKADKANLIIGPISDIECL